MEMGKDTRWRVRGELDFDKCITLQERRIWLVRTEALQNARGEPGELLVWHGTSVVCGRKFVFETTQSRFYPMATCVKHRRLVSSPG